MTTPARRAAWQVLDAVARRVSDLASALEHARRGLPDVRDRGLVSELSLGVLRWQAALDHAIGWAGNREARTFDAPVLIVLRLGAYQILHLTRVPASAAVNDAVSLCRAVGAPRAAGTVNAVLRRISRQRASIPWPAEDEPARYLHTTLSHPAWLGARWLARLGFARARAWAEFDNTPAPVVVRAHRWRESRESLAAWLEGSGVETRPATFAPDGLVVAPGAALADAGGQGSRFTIQDESSQLVAAFAGARPGDRVLDVCAAPGGKTAALAADVGAAGLVVAADLRPRRVRLLARTLGAAAVPGTAIVRADASRPLPWRPVFDAVLVDAPCSGLGTIRRDPDIRWRVQEADLAGLAAVQARMLQEAAAAVRPGGRLIYATCSSEPEENEQVVARFLEQAPGWRLEDPVHVRASLPASMRSCVDDQGFLKPEPDTHGLEPFFAARLVARR